MEQISQTFMTIGQTHLGYALEVSYRCVGRSEIWQYVSARQLALSELLQLIDDAAHATLPGTRPPSVAGQLPLSLD